MTGRLDVCRVGAWRITPQDRPTQLAAAYLAVARANHYMVGIVEPVTDDELDAAEQLLITEENKPATQRKASSKAISLALDLVEAEKQHRLLLASEAVQKRGWDGITRI